MSRRDKSPQTTTTPPGPGEGVTVSPAELRAVQKGGATPALVVHPFLKTEAFPKPEGWGAEAPSTLGGAGRYPEARLEEAVSLAEAIDLDIVDAVTVPLPGIRPATYMGSGKVAELGAFISANNIALVVMDCELSPGQQRNLERAWKTKVIDRTGLILEIFGERAQTREGRLQVQLAHLTYQKSRLVRSWTHLERQRGGVGFMGGPGETQIEADRRAIDEQISRIRKSLESVVRTRDLHRKARKDVPHPVVALVGYTNAGKSTLFNRLTEADVMAEDMLFATLDPTMRGLTLPSGRRVILSDTVGFISHLPTHLVAAFRATLEEVLEADIILHVRDVAHPETEAQREDVVGVMRDLGIEEGDDHAVIEVLNKIDLFDPDNRQEIETRAARAPDRVALSAISGDGTGNLLTLIDGELSRGFSVHDVELGYKEGQALAWLYENGEVLDRRDREKAIHLSVRLSDADWNRFEKSHAPPGH